MASFVLRCCRHCTPILDRASLVVRSPLILRRSLQQFPPRPVIDEKEIEEAFLKGSGPGGQKINKTSSAVQLKHIPSGLVVKCQETRSRSQNRKIARRILAEKLDFMDRGDESRVMVKAEVKRKKKASAAKKSRRKYRVLEELNGPEKEEAPEEDMSKEENIEDREGK